MNVIDFGSFNRQSIAILLLGVLWIGFNIYKSDLKVDQDADFRSIIVAANLINHGVYSEHVRGTKDQAPEPTRNHPPGYPFFLAAMAKVDGAVAPALTCYATHRSQCRLPFQLHSVIAVQYFLSAIALILAYLAATHFSGSIQVGALTTILIAVFGKFDRYAELIRPGVFYYVLIFAALYFTARACRNGSRVMASLSGLSFGLAGLFNPIYLLAGLLSAALLIPFVQRRNARTRSSPVAAVAPALFGLLLVAGIWLARSIVVFCDGWMFGSYLNPMMAQRIAFNAMEWQTWIAALVYWLPTYGDALASTFFNEAIYEPLKLAAPHGYISIGIREVLPTAQLEAGAGASVTWHLVTTNVMQMPLWHILTTVPIFLRGILGAGDLPTLVGLFLVAQHFKVAKARGEVGEAALLIAPLTIAMMVQATFTPNVIWQCLPIIFVFSYIVARRFGAL